MKLVALIKKEFHRFFHDPRLVLTILLPGVAIFLLYSIIGSLATAEPEKYDFRVYVSGSSALTQVLDTAVRESGSSVEWLTASEEEAKAAVENEEASALLIFSENFDGAFAGEEGSSVEIWYNGTEESAAFWNLASGVLQTSAMRFSVLSHSFETEEDLGKTLMANFLPFLVVVFVFSACMSVTLESVAGEKERGTLATILATSVKRSEVALGKIVPLSCISAIGAASSFLGVVLSLPKLMGTDLGLLGGYGVGSYFLLFFLILSFVPLIVSAITAVSAMSHSVKEASGYTGLVMILVMVVSMIAMFVNELGNWVIVVPVFNAVVSMGRILSGDPFVWQSLVSVGMNFLYTAVLVWAIAKMLSSERIMFGK